MTVPRWLFDELYDHIQDADDDTEMIVQIEDGKEVEVTNVRADHVGETTIIVVTVKR